MAEVKPKENQNLTDFAGDVFLKQASTLFVKDYAFLCFLFDIWFFSRVLLLAVTNNKHNRSNNK